VPDYPHNFSDTHPPPGGGTNLRGVRTQGIRLCVSTGVRGPGFRVDEAWPDPLPGRIRLP